MSKYKNWFCQQSKCVSVTFVLNIYVSDSTFQKLLEGQCLNRIRLTAPLYILLGMLASQFGISLSLSFLLSIRALNNFSATSCLDFYLCNAKTPEGKL